MFKAPYSKDDMAVAVNALRGGVGIRATAAAIGRSHDNLRARIARGAELVGGGARPRKAIEKQCVELFKARESNEIGLDAVNALVDISKDANSGARLGAARALAQAFHPRFGGKGGAFYDALAFQALFDEANRARIDAQDRADVLQAHIAAHCAAAHCAEFTPDDEAKVLARNRADRLRAAGYATPEQHAKDEIEALVDEHQQGAGANHAEHSDSDAFYW